MEEEPTLLFSSASIKDRRERILFWVLMFWATGFLSNVGCFSVVLLARSKLFNGTTRRGIKVRKKDRRLTSVRVEEISVVSEDLGLSSQYAAPENTLQTLPLFQWS